MGVLEFDCGFSVYPPLDPNDPSTIDLYNTYLATLSTKFEGRVEPSALSVDKRILITPATPRPDHASISPTNAAAFYCFMLPGLPKIPADAAHCDKFLGFSLAFRHEAGWTKETVEEYVWEVYVVAVDHFGDRVRYWHGLYGRRSNKQWGYYSRADIENAEDLVRKALVKKPDVMERGDGHIIA
ncbi:set protein 5 [Fusarium sporotrichioides]|uniref:Set protein 5 n=1 Tax=Fusarium sporotrichioides TaxID=5514 RepID=A0A395RL22_FUSSP|nr:set protein 5 [Fusarium sporotrichioides]